MRMLAYFINRAGRGLSPFRRQVLERAKRILSQQTEDKRPTNARERPDRRSNLISSATLRGQSLARDRHSSLSAASRLPV